MRLAPDQLTISAMNEHRVPLICFLTDNEIHNDICQDYWSLDADGDWSHAYTDLLSRYVSGRAELSSTIRLACRAYLPSLRCNGCGGLFEIKSRTDYPRLRKLLKRSLPSPTPKMCDECDSAISARAAESARAEAQINLDNVNETIHLIRERATPIDYEQLSYVESCFLYAALVSADVGPEDVKIHSLNSQARELSPTKKLSKEIYSCLYRGGILIPLPYPSAEAVGSLGQRCLTDFDVPTLDWTLAEDISGRTKEEIFSILFERLDRPEPEAVKDLWYHMAEHECEKYFLSLCARWNFVKAEIYSPTIAATVRQYLEILSIGQMWNVIFCVLKELAAVAQTNKYARQHIYNMIPGNIRRYADNRLAGSRGLTPWHRPQSFKEAWLTSIILDKVLKSGEVAFQDLSGRQVAKYVDDLNASRSTPVT